MNFNSLKIIVFIEHYGLVDSFIAVHFVYNVSAHYGTVVIATIAYVNVTKLTNMFFEPSIRLIVSSQFVQVLQTVAEIRVKNSLCDFTISFHSNRCRFNACG